MKEMVSLRGVAKKRRKQETDGKVNQMFIHCCGHATIVARQQPLFGFIESAPGCPLRQPSISSARIPDRSQPESDREGDFSSADSPRHRVTN